MAEYWAITGLIDVRSRIKTDGGRPLFAHFDAQLRPSQSNHDGVRTEHEFDNPDDEQWLPAIETGVEQFLRRWIEMGKPVCNTTFVMTRVIAHPIDTDDYAMARNVAISLDLQFEKNAVRIYKEDDLGECPSEPEKS